MLVTRGTKYAKLRLAQWALRLPFGIGEGINRLFIILGKFVQTETGSNSYKLGGSHIRVKHLVSSWDTLECNDWSQIDTH